VAKLQTVIKIVNFANTFDHGVNSGNFAQSVNFANTFDHGVNSGNFAQSELIHMHIEMTNASVQTHCLSYNIRNTHNLSHIFLKLENTKYNNGVRAQLVATLTIQRSKRGQP
jgi:hypothetical protein